MIAFVRKEDNELTVVHTDHIGAIAMEPQVENPNECAGVNVDLATLVGGGLDTPCQGGALECALVKKASAAVRVLGKVHVKLPAQFQGNIDQVAANDRGSCDGFKYCALAWLARQMKFTEALMSQLAIGRRTVDAISAAKKQLKFGTLGWLKSKTYSTAFDVAISSGTIPKRSELLNGLGPGDVVGCLKSAAASLGKTVDAVQSETER